MDQRRRPIVRVDRRFKGCGEVLCGLGFCPSSLRARLLAEVFAQEERLGQAAAQPLAPFTGPEVDEVGDVRVGRSTHLFNELNVPLPSHLASTTTPE